jgi:hypothetical protein
MPTPYINETKIYLLHPIRSPFKGLLYVVLGIFVGLPAFQGEEQAGFWINILNFLWIAVALHFIIKGFFLIFNRKKQVLLLDQANLYYLPVIDQDEEDLKAFEIKEIAVETLDLRSVTSFFKQKIQTQNQTSIEEIVFKINRNEHVFANTEFLSDQDWQDFQTLLERKISYGIWEISPVLLTMVTHESKANQNFVNTPKTLHLYLIAIFVIFHFLMKQQGLVSIEDLQLPVDETLDFFDILKSYPILDHLLLFKEFGALYPPQTDLNPLVFFSTIFVSHSFFQLFLHGFMCFKFLPILEYQIGKIKTFNLILLSSVFAYMLSYYVGHPDLTFGPAPIWMSAVGAIFFKYRYQRSSVQSQNRLSIEISQQFETDIKNTTLVFLVLISQLQFPFLSFDLIKYMSAFVFGMLFVYILEKFQKINQTLSILLAILSLISIFQLNAIQSALKEEHIRDQWTTHSKNAQDLSEQRKMISQLIKTQNALEIKLLAVGCVSIDCGAEHEQVLLEKLENIRMFNPFDRDLISLQADLFVKNQKINQAKKRYFQLLDDDLKKEINLPLDQRPISRNQDASYLARLWHQLALHDQKDQLSNSTQLLLPSLQNQIKITQQEDHLLIEIAPISKPTSIKQTPIQSFNLRLTFEQFTQNKITDLIQIDQIAFDQNYQIKINQNAETKKAPKNLSVRDVSFNFQIPTQTKIKHYQIKPEILLIP